MESLSERNAKQQKNRILRLFSQRDSGEHPSTPSSSSQLAGAKGAGASGSTLLQVPGQSSNQPVFGADVYWPIELLPSETPSARILVWGYESLGMRDISIDERESLTLHGRDLLFALHKERPAGRPLIFVAHSLGGLIVKETLRRSQSSGEDELQDVLRLTKSVIFFGTPHRKGSGYATFGDQALSIASILMQINPTDQNLRAFGFHKPELEQCTQSFTQQWSQYNFAVKTFQESRATVTPQGGFTNGKIVPDDSSSFWDARERCEQLQADHRGMVQYRGVGDPNYKKVAAELKAVLTSLIKGPNAFSEKENACIKSFWFPNIFTRQQQIHPAVQKTSEWLMESQVYKSWFGPEGVNKSSLMWVKGGPGAGKSTLLKTTFLQTAVDHQEYNTAAFYFDSNGSKLQKTATGVWQSIIYQLCKQDKHILNGMMKKYLDHVKQTVDGDWTWSLSELEGFMKDIASWKPKKTIIFIDGLDECEDTPAESVWSMLCIILQLSIERNVSLNICISSRSNPPEPIPTAVMEKYTNSDICRYVRNAFQIAIPNEPQAMSIIEKELSERAAGNFLWAKLASEYLLTELEEKNPLHVVIESIDNIPQQLALLYKAICQGTRPETKLLATRLFQWLLYSGKELTATQLWLALLFSIKGHTVETMKAWGFERDKVPNPTALIENIRITSRSLVNDNGITVQFAHESIRQYFTTGPGLGLVDSDLRQEAFGKTSLMLADSCLAILDAPNSLQESGCHWILMQYAQKHFITHAKNAESRNISTRPLLSRLENPSSRLWKLLKPAPNTPLLYFLCLHHLGSSALALVERGQSLRDMTQFPDFQVPLLGSLTFKQDREPFSLVLALLKHGSPVSVINEAGNTPLHLALRWGYTNIVDMLLNRYNAPLNAANNEGDLPVHICAKFGDSKLLDAILKKNTNLDVRNLAGATPLHIAAGAGNFATVNDLLVYGANVIVADNDGNDALLHSIRGSTQSTTMICETLIGHGANLSHRDSHQRTPFHHACRSSTVATVNLLADKGSELNVVDINGETGLHMASQRAAFDIIQNLLDRGVDTSLKNSQGLTPLELGLQFSKSSTQRKQMIEIYNKSDVTGHVLKKGSGKAYSWEPGDEKSLRK
jgi:ankyrin repeat protein